MTPVACPALPHAFWKTAAEAPPLSPAQFQRHWEARRLTGKRLEAFGRRSVQAPLAASSRDRPAHLLPAGRCAGGLRSSGQTTASVDGRHHLRGAFHRWLLSLPGRFTSTPKTDIGGAAHRCLDGQWTRVDLCWKPFGRGALLGSRLVQWDSSNGLSLWDGWCRDR